MIQTFDIQRLKGQLHFDIMMFHKHISGHYSMLWLMSRTSSVFDEVIIVTILIILRIIMVAAVCFLEN